MNILFLRMANVLRSVTLLSLVREIYWHAILAKYNLRKMIRFHKYFIKKKQTLVENNLII